MSEILMPFFKWAQDVEKVYVTILLSGATDVEVIRFAAPPPSAARTITFTLTSCGGRALQGSIRADGLKFRASLKGSVYELDLTLKHGVDEKRSRLVKSGRTPRFELAKQDTKVYWNVLPKDKRLYKNFCKADFDRWMDEDDWEKAVEEAAKKKASDASGEAKSGKSDESATGVPPSPGGMSQDDIQKMLSEVSLNRQPRTNFLGTR